MWVVESRRRSPVLPERRSHFLVHSQRWRAVLIATLETPQPKKSLNINLAICRCHFIFDGIWRQPTFEDYGSCNFFISPYLFFFSGVAVPCSADGGGHLTRCWTFEKRIWGNASGDSRERNCTRLQRHGSSAESLGGAMGSHTQALPIVAFQTDFLTRIVYAAPSQAFFSCLVSFHGQATSAQQSPV